MSKFVTLHGFGNNKFVEQIIGNDGIELNFEVVGGTVQPENPKENTIWVNTDVEITSWDFCVNEPYHRSGTKNLNNYPYYHTTQTTNGITFTDNGDGTVTANGTATADAYFRCQNTEASPSYNTISLTPGTYTLWDSANNSDCRAEVGISYDNGSTWKFYTCNNGAITIEVLYEALARINLLAKSGKTIDNLVLKPQLEKGSTPTEFIKGSSEGQVWIHTSTYADISVQMNALTKNNVEIFPNSCSQYINGAWIDKDPMTFRKGSWVDWTLWIYDTGIINEEVAGTVAMTDSNNAFTLNSTSIHINSIGENAWGTIYFTTPIDLTSFKTLYMEGQVTITGAGNYWGSLQFGVVETLGAVPVAYIEGAKAQGTHSVDVSSLEGLHYIAVRLKGFANYAVADINKIYLKR